MRCFNMWYYYYFLVSGKASKDKLDNWLFQQTLTSSGRSRSYFKNEMVQTHELAKLQTSNEKLLSLK